jgi:hypothetical protein
MAVVSRCDLSDSHAIQSAADVKVTPSHLALSIAFQAVVVSEHEMAPRSADFSARETV